MTDSAQTRREAIEPLQPLLRAEDISKLLSVRTSTVYEWVRMEYIPHIRLGAELTVVRLLIHQRVGRPERACRRGGK